jgi:predicted O-methyltransferase YrrM
MKIRHILILFSISLIFSQAIAAAGDKNKEQSLLELHKHYAKNYDFTLDDTFNGPRGGFILQIPTWEKVLGALKGKPDIHYLEIGVNEGRSAIWVLENILTHPTAKLTGIDLFPEGTDFKEKYFNNLKLSGYAQKATTITGFSQIKLRTLPLNSFDIIYVDGDHRAAGVLADAVLSWDLLKPGGFLIFDDYLWFDKNLPEELRPQIAIDSFITANRNSLEVIHRGYQMIVKKREGFCDCFPVPPMGCIPFGQYVYVWNYADKKNEIYNKQDMKNPIVLSDRERQLIEKIIMSTDFGKAKPIVSDEILANDTFIELSKRLNLDMNGFEIKKERGFFENLSKRLFPSSGN